MNNIFTKFVKYMTYYIIVNAFDYENEFYLGFIRSF